MGILGQGEEELELRKRARSMKLTRRKGGDEEFEFIEERRNARRKGKAMAKARRGVEEVCLREASI